MIKNITANQIISKKEIYCKSAFFQGLGLMFRSKQNLVMEFKKEKFVNLHNFFVFYPLDILILDKNRKIIEIKEDFKPFTFWNSKRKGKYVVELASSVQKSDYRLNDKVEIYNNNNNNNKLK